jgi:magnesium transporter
MLRIAAREAGKPVEIIPDTAVTEWLQKPTALVWVDIRNTDDNDYIWLARYFDFHAMAMEDVLENHLRPKMDLFGDHAFMVYYGACRNDETNEIELQEVELFFGANYVVTVHDEPLDVLEHTFQRWQSNLSPMDADVGALLYNIMDSVMDSYFPVLDWVTERLDTLETRILERYSPELLRDVVGLKQGLLRLRKVVGPQRDVVNSMLRGECNFLPPTSEAYLQDLYDHALRIVESVDNYREMTTTVMDGLRSAQNNEINEVMRRLTILNLLFLPLAVLTGFFGMNFTGIPFDNPWLMVIALCAMVILPFSLYQYLQSKRWL